jgi:hypothetical protein
MSMRNTRTTIVAFAAIGVLALAACGDDDDSSSTTVAPVGTAASATPTTSGGAVTTAASSGGSATTAAGGGAATTAAAGGDITGSLDASDQSSDGSSLTVSTVSINGSSGFIAIHQDAGGQPGPVVGHVDIPEGDSSDVVIPFDSPVTTGAFWPMLHLDAGTKGTYEFPGPDGPVKSGSDIVMKKITLTVG